MSNTPVTLELTEEEAEWLGTALTLLMHVARHWDNRTDKDIGNHLFAKLSLARVQGNVGMDPDEWLAQAQEGLNG
jgi:hypothetical protein